MIARWWRRFSVAGSSARLLLYAAHQNVRRSEQLNEAVTVQVCFRAIHNAIRRDVGEIDRLAYQMAAKGGDVVAVAQRLDRFYYMLDFHAQCENAVVLPVLEKVAPLLAYTYHADHDEMGVMQQDWHGVRQQPDGLDVARLTSALKSHTLLHLEKEDHQLYSVLEARTSVDERASILRSMVGEVSDEASSDTSEESSADGGTSVTPWLFGLLEADDQATIARWFVRDMPPSAWAQTRALMREALGPHWDALVQRVPELRQATNK